MNERSNAALLWGLDLIRIDEISKFLTSGESKEELIIIGFLKKYPERVMIRTHFKKARMDMLNLEINIIKKRHKFII